MSPLEPPNARNRIRRLLRRPGPPIEAVVAEDDPLYAARLILALGRGNDLDVVGRAHNGAESVQLAARSAGRPPAAIRLLEARSA